ncbi:DUF3027 domain-containing protein [Arthrobacter sp. FW305-BF8]|uniref:DUF3027 domain-containing protein n=1 Tax=Arthrobacter sp. FW305-BF8 TaxID=2879617 RepID=UPI001F2A928B|nr:DUF3027 domain-containing protein [Arthrobacter sp. FW305-BF8]UKA55308.1 DUF3027 domain-containing protein [Arthrobacter sp. FW305-BF8]
MNPEPEQAESKVEPKAPQRRTGVPVWRMGKPDAVLAAAVDAARTAIEGIAKASEIGDHLAARTEGDRVVTHLFESRLPGYLGWQWYAVLTRNSRSKVITVNELGLLPSEDSILAPEWVPWAERVRPEDEQEQDEQEAPGEASTGSATEPDAGPGTDVEAESDVETATDAEAAPSVEAEPDAHERD